MSTIIRYTKAISKKALAIAVLPAMVILKAIFRVVLAIYKLAVYPFVIFCLISFGSVFFGTPVMESLIHLGFAAVAIAMYFTLPAALPMMDAGIERLIRVVRRPLVVKSRLTYTFG